MPFGYEGWAHEGREPAKIGSVTLFANLIEHYGLAKFSDEERNILLVNKKALQARMEQLLPRSAAAAAPATSDTFVRRPRPAPGGRPIPRPDGIMIPHQGRDRKCAVWSTQAGLCIKTGCASSCPKVQDSWSRAALLVTNPWAACAAQQKQITSDLRSCRDDPPYDPRDVPRTFSRCSRVFSSRTRRAGTKPLGTGSWRRTSSNLWRRFSGRLGERFWESSPQGSSMAFQGLFPGGRPGGDRLRAVLRRWCGCRSRCGQRRYSARRARPGRRLVRLRDLRQDARRTDLTQRELVVAMSPGT